MVIKKSKVNTNFVNSNEVNKVLNKFKPDIIVNLICFSDVEKCEDQIDKAYNLNTLVVKI